MLAEPEAGIIMVAITEEKLNEMFDHYIDLEAKERQESHGSYNEAWISGECEEAQRWLKMFGVDVSYDRVKPLVEERCKKYGY